MFKDCLLMFLSGCWLPNWSQYIKDLPMLLSRPRRCWGCLQLRWRHWSITNILLFLLGVFVSGDVDSWRLTQVEFYTFQYHHGQKTQKEPVDAWGGHGNWWVLVGASIDRCSVCPWGPVSTYSRDSSRCDMVWVMVELCRQMSVRWAHGQGVSVATYPV